MRNGRKAAPGLRSYRRGGKLLGLQSVPVDAVRGEKGGVSEMIPTKDRRQVCLEQCAVYDGVKKRAVAAPETWEKCTKCGMEAHYITARHMEEHGYGSRSAAKHDGELVKVLKSFKRGA